MRPIGGKTVDRSRYLEHSRQRLIREFIHMVENMPEEEIFERIRTCPNCLEIVSEKSHLEHAIIEGSSETEIDSMLGVDDHCDGGDGGDNDDDPASLTDSDEDDDITASFRESISMLSDMDDITFVISYVHKDPNAGSQDGADLIGKIFLYGRKDALKAMLSQLDQRVDQAFGDDVLDLS